MEGALSRLTEDLKRVESQATESRVRTAALSEKKENAHLNMENRITLREELSQQTLSLQTQMIEMGQKRDRIKEEASQAESSLEEGRRKLVELVSKRPGLPVVALCQTSKE